MGAPDMVQPTPVELSVQSLVPNRLFKELSCGGGPASRERHGHLSLLSSWPIPTRSQPRMRGLPLIAEILEIELLEVPAIASRPTVARPTDGHKIRGARHGTR